MITNLGELKSSGYQSTSIKDELRQNLLKHLEAGTTVFGEVHGFEDTVCPSWSAPFCRGTASTYWALGGRPKHALRASWWNCWTSTFPM